VDRLAECGWRRAPLDAARDDPELAEGSGARAQRVSRDKRFVREDGRGIPATGPAGRPFTSSTHVSVGDSG